MPEEMSGKPIEWHARRETGVQICEWDDGWGVGYGFDFSKFPRTALNSER